MPLFDYTCDKDGAFEVIRKYDDRETPIECPVCNKPSPYTPSYKTGSPVFKGTGFYQTDYKNPVPNFGKAPKLDKETKRMLETADGR